MTNQCKEPQPMEWTPSDLLELYHSLDKYKDDLSVPATGRDAIAAIRGLITRPEMKRVWPELEKALPRNTGREADNIGLTLAAMVIKSLGVASRSLESQTQIVDRFADIRRLARKLSRRIKDTELDASPYWFSEVREHRAQRFSGQELLGFTMANILSRLAKEADELARNAPATLVPHPRRTNARRVAFVRTIGPLFKEHFGDYLYGTLATVASIALDDADIDSDKVRFILRPPPVKSRRTKD